MKLINISKKLISCVLALDIIITGLTISPNKFVQAAADTPEVKVLGATLRTEGNTTGTQSLRIAIQVKNASKAGACGVDIRVKDSGNNFTTISTEDEKYKKIYSKDNNYDIVIYTVVIANIPVDKAAEDFEIQGFAKELEADDKISTEVATKSVQGVVDAMKNTYGDGLTLESTGKLSLETSIPLTGAINVTGGTSIYNSDTSSISASSITDILIPLPAGLINSGDTASITLYGTSDGGGTPRIRLAKDANNCVNTEGWNRTGGFNTEENYTANANAPFIEVKTTSGTFTSLSITSIIVKKDFAITTPNINSEDCAVPVDLSTMRKAILTKDGTEIDNQLNGTYDSSSNTVSINDDNGISEYYFTLPNKMEIGDTIRITIKGTKTGTNGFRFWVSDTGSSGSFCVSPKLFDNLQQGEFSETFELTSKTVECFVLTLKQLAGWDDGNRIDGLTIDKITVEPVFKPLS